MLVIRKGNTMEELTYINPTSPLARYLFKNNFTKPRFSITEIAAVLASLFFRDQQFCCGNPSLLLPQGELRDALGISSLHIDDLKFLLGDFLITITPNHQSLDIISATREIWGSMRILRLGYPFRSERRMLKSIIQTLEHPFEAETIIPETLSQLLEKHLPQPVTSFREIFISVQAYAEQVNSASLRANSWSDSQHIFDLSATRLGAILGVTLIHRQQLALLVMDITKPLEGRPRFERHPNFVLMNFLEKISEEERNKENYINKIISSKQNKPLDLSTKK